MGKVVQCLIFMRRPSSVAPSEQSQGVPLVSLRESADHDDFIKASDAKVPRVNSAVTVLVKVSEGGRRGDVNVGSHERPAIDIDLEQ